MLRSIRWWIAGVIVAAAVLNYLDRQALSVASATIRDEMHLSAVQYQSIVNAFLVAYTLSYLFGGMLVDRLGTRRGLLYSVAWWSVANMLHAFARTPEHLSGCRFLLGLGEGMFFPAAIRASAEWFRPEDRSRPVGLMLAGSTVGAIIAPPIVSFMIHQPGLGWRSAFALTGALGFLVIPAWLAFYHRPDQHPRMTPEERAYLGEQASGKGEQRARPWPLPAILSTRPIWILIVARFLTDASWYLTLFWLIQYLQKARGFTTLDVAYLGWIPFAAADLGAIAGGWTSTWLIQRGMPVVRARKTCMLCFAMLMTLSLVGFLTPHGLPYVALALFSAATFGHMAWGTNSLTVHGDIYPAGSVATVMGITGAAGSLGGVCVGGVVAQFVDSTQSYLPIFLTTALLHPIAATIVYFGLESGGPMKRFPPADEGPPEFAQDERVAYAGH